MRIGVGAIDALLVIELFVLDEFLEGAPCDSLVHGGWKRGAGVARWEPDGAEMGRIPTVIK